MDEHIMLAIQIIWFVNIIEIAPIVALGGVGTTGGERGIQLARFANSLPTCRCAAALVEQGSKAQNSLGRKTKRPREGAFSFSGGEGGIRTHGTGKPHT